MWGELAYSLRNFDGYILTMLVLGAIGLATFFQRFISIQFFYHIDFAKFLNNLRKMVNAEDIDRAISHCKNYSSTSLPHIALKALEAAETDPTTVRGTIDEETIDFLPKVESGLGVLPSITLLIMLVGILGTIDSLWSAFHAVDVLDSAKTQASLAQGIASSLNTTAIALIAGMVFLAGNQILKGMAVRLIDRIHHGVSVLSNLLVPHEYAAYAPAPQPMAAGAGAGDQSVAASEAYEAPSESEGDAVDDSFDDVSVEDIKDEEEII